MDPSIMDDIFNTLQLRDCIEAMNELPEGSADLVFADPPFNIGYAYDVYDDSLEYRKYLEWSAEWIGAVHRVLKPDGTFWLAIGDDYAAELTVESKKIGFHCRSWVIWYYTFGVNCARKFSRSHTHLLHFIKDPDNFTFRADDPENRVPSARELVYNDRRANARGRLPDDTWIIRPPSAAGELQGDDSLWDPWGLDPPSDEQRTFILRPQDLEESFKPTENTWYFPRVAGTFRERTRFHGCQMPEQLLGRIIRTCSNPGDMVLDPFSGSATTLAVAKKLGRRYIGFDISEDYVNYGRERLKNIRVGDRLDGSPEPVKSAPRTFGNVEKKKRRKKSKSTTPLKAENRSQELKYDQSQIEMAHHGVIEAFRLTHDGFSTDRLVADPDLNSRFIATCVKFGLPGDPCIWNTLLFHLRKSGKLAHIETSRKTHIPWERCDRYLFASEVAWQMMLDDNAAESLDEILCDPALAEQFDKIARKFATGYQSFEYRWGALKLRKQAKCARSRAAVLKAPPRLGNTIEIDNIREKTIPREPGLYVISNGSSRLYVGETFDLAGKFTTRPCQAWQKHVNARVVQLLPINHSTTDRLAWQSCLVRKYKPRLNCFELQAVP